MNGLDVSLFRAINSWPDSMEPFWVFLTEATKRREGLVLLGLIALSLIAWRKTRIATVIALLTWPIANATTDVLKDAWRWPRPSSPEMLARYADFHVRVKPLDSFGTASAHAANMMAIAVVFLWLYRPVGYCWLVVALLTGLSRIYVGVHWPSQVLLGWICGALCATVMVKSIESARQIWSARKEQIQESQAEAP